MKQRVIGTRHADEHLLVERTVSLPKWILAILGILGLSTAVLKCIAEAMT